MSNLIRRVHPAEARKFLPSRGDFPCGQLLNLKALLFFKMWRMLHALPYTDKGSPDSNMCVPLLSASLHGVFLGQISKILLDPRQVLMEHFSLLFVMLVMVCILSIAVIIIWLLKLVFISGEQASFRQVMVWKLYALLCQEQIELRPCMKFIYKGNAWILQSRVGSLMFFTYTSCYRWRGLFMWKTQFIAQQSDSRCIFLHYQNLRNILSYL